MVLNIQKMKETVRASVQDSLKFPEREEDLRDLHITIENMHLLFSLITHEQMIELLEPIERAAAEYDINIKRHFKF